VEKRVCKCGAAAYSADSRGTWTCPECGAKISAENECCNLDEEFPVVAAYYVGNGEIVRVRVRRSKPCGAASK
jgi:hypothetical protein